MRVINYQIICAMEIKILVKENEKAELDKFIETCKEYGMQLIREGGGKLPNFSGYYAELKGVRWQKADTGEGQYNIPAVSNLACDFCGQPAMDGETHCEKCSVLRVI